MHFGRLTAIVGVVATAGIPLLQPGQSARPEPARQKPWIEQRAPGAFDRTRPGSVEATYRIDARLLMPLLVTSLPIWSVRDIGVARVSVWRWAPEKHRLIESFEFFARSFPERARSFDRIGLFREVEEYVNGEAIWAAYFGAMSLSPEKTLDEARQAARKGATPMPFELIDGLATATEEVTAIYRAPGQNSPRDPESLYAELRPAMSAPAIERDQLAGGAAGIPVRSFLGALHASLLAARTRLRGAGSDRHLFPYNSVMYALDLLRIEQDASAGRLHASQGFATDAKAVYRLTYRIWRMGRQKPGTPFTVWAELSAGSNPAGPIVPLSFSVQPRSFLQLSFQRTR